MALYKYFKPADGLPDPSGPLSAAVSPAAIREANEAVKGVTGGSAKARGKYAKLTPEQQAAIGEYASPQSQQSRYPCKRLSPLPLQKRTPFLHLRYKGGVAIRDA